MLKSSLTIDTNLINKQTDSIYDIIHRSKYSENNCKSYISNPIIGKESCWNPLGDKLSANEKNCPYIINPNKYFTIRLDGKNFSSVISKLKQLLIFEQGYSIKFENIMKTIAQKVCTYVSRVLYVFTQSDEITILINKVVQPNTDTIQSHDFSGRRDKLMTLICSYVTQVFNIEVIKLCMNMPNMTDNINLLPTIVFDARIGTYDTLLDAFELILWRAYDCSTNGLSSAVYFNSFNGITKKEQAKMNSNQKLQLLEHNNMLPLPNHQAYGTLLKRSIIAVEVVDKQTGLTKIVEKKCYIPVVGPIVKNIKDNKFPEIIEYDKCVKTIETVTI